MSLAGEQVLLRAFFQSADRPPLAPTYERMVQAARKAGLSGATVLRGVMGFGSLGLIKHSAWSVAEHVPVIVEIVDRADRIVDFIEGPLDKIMLHGMVTLERANVMLFRERKRDPPIKLRLGSLLAPASTLPRIEERGRMKINERGVLLRIFIGESDRCGNQRLYEAIVGKARELGLAGATVLRGTEGFGAHSVVHRASLLDMSTDLPVVIEIVDSKDHIEQLLPHLENMVQEGMITTESVVVILYRPGTAAEPAAP